MQNSTPEKEETPLQRFVSLALAAAPKPRDHYDRMIQERTGTKGKPIYDIQRGKSLQPSLTTLQHIAEVLGQPIDRLTAAAAGQLVTPVEPVRGADREEAGQPSRSYAPSPDIPPTRSASDGDGAIDIRQVDLAYAMGDGANIEDYPEEGTIKFDPNFLRVLTRSPADRLFVARGDGDSMMPTLINDDMVLIDTAQRRLNMQDRIWAVSLHGAGMIKRLRVIDHETVHVISDNPNVPGQEVAAEDLFIVGRVIWIGRRI
ncbi:S24 family peptidase [Sphingomonas oleivorans]|nr:helix-turn-helix transcriptional regulator [Sphingomonas oleivorans]